MALPSPVPSQIPAFTPEFMAHDDGPALLGGITILMVLAIISVVLRFWIRQHRGMELKLDDWLIAASMVPFLGLIVCAYCSVFLAGVGKHYQVNILEDPTRPTTQLKIVYASLITIVTNISLVKLSIITMYYRIFPTRFMKWSYIILGTIIVVWAVVALPVSIFQCIPIEEAWVFDPSSGACISSFPLYFGATGLPNVTIDLVLLCLPMYEVWKLQVPRAQKVAIVTTFLLGAVVIVADVFKLVVLVEISAGYQNQDNQRAVSSLGTDKFQDLIIWIVTEHALSIICANIPSLRPVLTMFLRWTGLSPKSDPGRPAPKQGLVTIGCSGASGANLVGRHYDSDRTDGVGLGQKSLTGEDSDEHISQYIVRPTLPITSIYRPGPTARSDSVARSNSQISKKSIIDDSHCDANNIMSNSGSKIDHPDWPPASTTSEYRVTISSNPPTRTNSVWTTIPTDRDIDRHIEAAAAAEPKTGARKARTEEGGEFRGRTRSLRGFHTNTANFNDKSNNKSDNKSESNSRSSAAYQYDRSTSSSASSVPSVPAIAVTTHTEVAWGPEVQMVVLAQAEKMGVGV